MAEEGRGSAREAHEKRGKAKENRLWWPAAVVRKLLWDVYLACGSYISSMPLSEGKDVAPALALLDSS